jgi:hypothetical protein
MLRVPRGVNHDNLGGFISWDNGFGNQARRRRWGWATVQFRESCIVP